MAEVLESFDRPVRGRNGRVYRARACGRATENGMWDGWIEFLPLDGGTPLRTRRETTQPKRSDLAYWATGLSSTYLEGALERVLVPRSAPSPRPLELPAFEGPAPEPEVAAQGVSPRAVLDPFVVYAEGSEILRDQLHALSASQLRNIVRAHGLGSEDESLDLLGKPELAALILAAVARRSRTAR